MENNNITSENTAKESGRLVVRVRTASGAIPVEGAVVTVFVSGSGKPLYRVTTDSAGVTPTMTLDAPPRELTLHPASEGKPYAEYDLVTEADGYYGVTNIALPVYSGVTSIQPVELIPLADDNGRTYSPETDRFFDESAAPEL